MIIAVDTGATKTLIAGFNQDGEPGETHKFETPKDQFEYTQKLLEVLHSNFKPKEIDAIVIAVPGIVKNNKILWCGNLPWKDFDLGGALEPHYDCPIGIGNDADIAGIAEANLIDPVPELCLYLTVSTGVGCGIVINGKLDPALTRTEAGHMMLGSLSGLKEWEDYASGSAIKKKYDKFAYEIDDNEAWRDIALNIGHGMVALIPLLQPDVVVIGGSIGTHFPHYKKYLLDWVEETLPSGIIRPRIVQAEHPQEAVIYGCYYYAVRQFD